MFILEIYCIKILIVALNDINRNVI